MYCFQQENYKCEHTFSLWSQDGDHYLVLVWKKRAVLFFKDYSEVSNALNDLSESGIPVSSVIKFSF